MSAHALFSPSAAHRWVECPGSFAYPGNTQDGESSIYADDGTASHNLAARALQSGEDCEYFLGTKSTLNGKDYVTDEERCGYVQVYVDLVRRLAIGKTLFIEHWVDTSKWLGEGQGGTADAGILDPDTITAVDLKYGMGERVDAAYIVNGKRLPNHQLALYAAGLLIDALLLGYRPKKAVLVVCQPRLSHIDEQEFTIEEILELADRAAAASKLAGVALIGTPEDAMAKDLMHPGEKTCRWCRAKAECPKLSSWVAEQVRCDFETIAADAPAKVETDTRSLSLHMLAVPLIQDWCHAVLAAAAGAVDAGLDIMGSDGQAMKFVEGKPGKREWDNPELAEATLLAQVGPEKAYQPRKVITAPAAAKILDKKATKELWKDIFTPMIKRAPGRRLLVLGSDPRPKFSGAADASEFEEGESDE